MRIFALGLELRKGELPLFHGTKTTTNNGYIQRMLGISSTMKRFFRPSRMTAAWAFGFKDSEICRKRGAGLFLCRKGLPLWERGKYKGAHPS